MILPKAKDAQCDAFHRRQIDLQLGLLSARLCTIHKHGEVVDGVPYYLRFIDSTGWGGFRKYLLKSITNQWDSLSVKQHYEVLEDLCKLRMPKGWEDSIQNKSEDDFTPKSLWEYLETDYELAVSSFPTLSDDAGLTEPSFVTASQTARVRRESYGREAILPLSCTSDSPI